MVTTHRTLRGAWTRCIKPEACQLLFHFPGMTPAQMKATPLELLLPVLEAFQPPRVVSEYGEKTWIEDGGIFTMGRKIHRDYDLPAVVKPDGTREWWSHGRRHRSTGGPAEVDQHGNQLWWERGNHHRGKGLPAIIYSDGSTEYWERGFRHRDDGPAVDWVAAGGAQEWWVHGHVVVGGIKASQAEEFFAELEARYADAS